MLYIHHVTLFCVCLANVKCCCWGFPNSNSIVLIRSNLEQSQKTKNGFDMTYHGDIILSIYIGYFINLIKRCMC